MNEIPDWAEFTFVAGGDTYYGSKEGYVREGGARRSYWRERDYAVWKADESSQEIIRQLEND